MNTTRVTWLKHAADFNDQLIKLDVLVTTRKISENILGKVIKGTKIPAEIKKIYSRDRLAMENRHKQQRTLNNKNNMNKVNEQPKVH